MAESASAPAPAPATGRGRPASAAPGPIELADEKTVQTLATPDSEPRRRRLHRLAAVRPLPPLQVSTTSLPRLMPPQNSDWSAANALGTSIWHQQHGRTLRSLSPLNHSESIVVSRRRRGRPVLLKVTPFSPRRTPPLRWEAAPACAPTRPCPSSAPRPSRPAPV